MTEHTEEIDLSSDGEQESGLELETEQVEDTQTETEKFDNRVKRSAKQILESADGRSEYERATNALEEAKASLDNHQRQRTQTVNKREEYKRRIDRIEETVNRVKQLPDTALCTQQLSGGVTVEVLPDGHQSSDEEEGFTRSDLIDDLEETAEVLGEEIEALEERARSMEKEIEVLQAAYRRISTHREMLDDTKGR